MDNTIAYTVRTLELTGIKRTTIFVTPAPREPVFGKFSIFNADARALSKKRKSLISHLDATITGELLSRSDIDRDVIRERLVGLETLTLEVLARELDCDTRPQEVVALLNETLCRTPTKIREVAVFHRHLRGVTVNMAAAILDRIRIDSSPLFAYEDFTRMSESEQEIFTTVVRFYYAAYRHWVYPRGDESFVPNPTSLHHLQLVLDPIPALTPKVVILIAENPDRREDIIEYVSQRHMDVVDAEAVREYLTSPAPAISHGVL